MNYEELFFYNCNVLSERYSALEEDLLNFVMDGVN